MCNLLTCRGTGGSHVLTTPRYREFPTPTAYAAPREKRTIIPLSRAKRTDSNLFQGGALYLSSGRLEHREQTETALYCGRSGN